MLQDSIALFLLENLIGDEFRTIRKMNTLI